MEKLYDRIDWHNNTSPDINETNLNRMSKAVDDIDDRVVDIAGTVMETVPQIQEDLAEAQELIEDAEELTTHPPIIGQNGHWWTWDTSIDDYADSGVDAGVSLTIGTTSTLTPGSDATVTNSGTATDPILNFGIPAGVAGQNGQDGADGADGADGVSPMVTIGTITGGHSVTITDADHPTGQTFNVMDGTNGQDGHGVPSGGTTGQVLAKASGTDYDTEWVNASGGSGGHTILDSNGDAMTSRGNLQFNGATVTDDSTNDKTIVTPTDTKNTAGSTDSSSKLFLIGATSQAANPQTYSQDTAYVGTDGNLYSGSKIVATQNMIGDAWASGQSYAVGDYRIDGNVLYKCKTAHTSSASNRPPYASYWDAVSVSSQLGGGGETETLLYTIDVTPTGSAVSNRLYPSIDTSSYKKLKIVCGLYYNNTAYCGIGSQEYNMADFSFIDAAAHPKDLRFYSSYSSTTVVCRWTNSNTIMNDVAIYTSINTGTVSCKCFAKIYGIK